MDSKKNNKVSLSVGNWIALCGLVLAVILPLGVAVANFNAKMAVLESNDKHLHESIEKLEQKIERRLKK